MADPPRIPMEKPLYELEADPVVPRLTGTVILRKDPDDLHSALGAELLIHAFNCVRTFGDFHLALSGGASPLPFYRRLMSDPMFRELPWKRTHLWLVDERRVAEDDDRCNWSQIAGYLLDHSDIPRGQAHPMRQLEPNADELYEAELREALAWREKGQDRLDFVLLGMGADGHTASLFPRSAALGEKDKLIAINAGAGVTPPDRVTMTYPLLSSARFIAVLATGAPKRAAIARVAAGADDPDSYKDLPILGVRPLGDGILRWYLDHEACPG